MVLTHPLLLLNDNIIRDENVINEWFLFHGVPTMQVKMYNKLTKNMLYLTNKFIDSIIY